MPAPKMWAGKWNALIVLSPIVAAALEEQNTQMMAEKERYPRERGQVGTVTRNGAKAHWLQKE